MRQITKIFDRKVFLTAFFTTIIIHGEIIFNKISFHDDLDTLFDGWTNSIRHGRWMYRLLSLFPEKLAGMESIPVLIGCIVASCIGLLACVIFAQFQIKKYQTQFALIVIFSTIPVIAGEFGYMGYAGYDLIGKLLCVISAYLVCEGINGKKSYLSVILAALVLACSIGEYQCHLTFFLSILLIYFIQSVLHSELTWKEFWTKAFYYVGTALLGLFFYLIILQLSLKIADTQLTSYAGMDSYGIVEISGYVDRFMTCYTDFFNLNAKAAYEMFPFHWNGWKLLILLVLFGLVAITIVVESLKRNYKKIIQIIIAVCLLPLAFNFNFILYGMESVHSLHMYQFVLMYLLIFILAEEICHNMRDDLSNIGIVQIGMRLMRGTVLVIVLLFGVLYARYDNVCYMQLEMRQESAIRYFTSMITRIESIDGYKKDYPIAFVNSEKKENLSDHVFVQYDPLVTNPFGYEIVNGYNWNRFVTYWCGFEPTYADGKSYENHPEVREMPAYPDDGSICIIDNVIVVKF